MANSDSDTQVNSAPASAEAGVRFPRWFGPYILLRRIARGGMGDVCLAKQIGAVGIERMCVVKSLRANLTDDDEYTRRFIDEARTVVQLTHKNICPVLDVGTVDGRVYLAMELIHGRDLRTVHERAPAFPQAIALHVIGEVLEALDYAHRLTDGSGKPLGIVHRDVSPQNVMVSFEGEVKLIDFGLAQSTLKVERTEPGVVLGKLAYMASEQARGEAIDGRSDIYAVGVMLYELLVGERYYEGFTLDEVWRVVGSGRFRAQRMSDLDDDLRAIVEKAVTEKLDVRYRTCGELRRDLHEYAVARRQVASAADVRAFMESLFGGASLEEKRARADLAALPAPAEPYEPTQTTRFATASSSSPSSPPSSSSPSLSSSSPPAPWAAVASALASSQQPAPPASSEASSVFAAVPATLEQDTAATPVALAAPAADARARPPWALGILAVTAVVMVVALVVVARGPDVATPAVAAAPDVAVPAAPPVAAAPDVATPVGAAPPAPPDVATPDIVATPPATPVAPPPPAPPERREVVAPRGRPSPRSADASTKPRHAPIPEPPLAPLSARAAWLSTHCKRLACTASVVEDQRRFAVMPVDEARAHKRAVDACVSQCKP